mmetsp:Transcript_132175/g.410763  ORF Transcript_132175/g.410763 Transcript_132175/m.410763 type:complete len:670 (+) Transcript_132175:189-2198(+)
MAIPEERGLQPQGGTQAHGRGRGEGWWVGVGGCRASGRSASPVLGGQEDGALVALDGDPAGGAVLLCPPPDPQHLQVSLEHRPLEHLHGLPDLELPQGHRALDLQGVLDDGGGGDLVVRRPGPQSLLPHGDPANGAVTQRLALGADDGLEALLLGALEDLHGLILGQHPHDVGALTGESLLQGDLTPHGEELRALLRIHRARVALDGDPACEPVLHGLASDAVDAGALLRAGPLQHLDGLAHLHLPYDLALLDVLHVGHGNGHRASVVLAARLGLHHALAVLGREPADGAVLAATRPHAQGVADLVLAWALEDLQDLLGPQLAERRRRARTEVGLHGQLREAAEEGLAGLLEEGRALVPLHADPPGDAVAESLAADAGDPELLVTARALEDLNDLVNLQHALGLALANLEIQRDSDLLHADVVLLHQPQEAPAAHATGLYMPRQELGLLLREAEVGQVPQLLGEGVLGDLLCAACKLQEDVLQADVPALHLLTEGSCSLGRGGGGDLGAGCLHGGQQGDALLLRVVNLHHDLRHGLLGLVQGAPRCPRHGALVACEAGLDRRHAGGELCGETLAVLLDGERRGEGLQRGALDGGQGLHGLLEPLGRGLHGVHALVHGAEDRLRRLLVADLLLHPALGLLLLGVLLLGVRHALLHVLDLLLRAADLRPEL